jgi:hypothetical protein
LNVPRTIKAALVLAIAAGVPLFAPAPAMTQDNSPGPQNSGSGSYYGSYAPADSAYGYAGYPRWTFQYGPIHSTPGWSYYRPLQPSDWGYGPCGPRHNLNSSQKSPSGMTWW